MPRDSAKHQTLHSSTLSPSRPARKISAKLRSAADPSVVGTHHVTSPG